MSNAIIHFTILKLCVVLLLSLKTNTAKARRKIPTSIIGVGLLTPKGTAIGAAKTINPRPVAPELSAFIHELDGLLLEKIKPLAVFFPYAIADLKEYERVIRCKPSKSKNQLAIHFDRKFWEEPILSANYELQNFLLQKVNIDAGRKKSEQFADKIYQYLMANAYLGILSLEDVASNFNVTPRSLQRRLQVEGATFQQLSDTVRKSLALHYMEAGNHPIKEISIMLGYNELSAFSRAFKRWTGKAPMSYLS